MKKRISISLIAASMALGVSASAFFNSHEKALTKTEAASVSTDDYYSECEGLSGSSLQSKLLSINSPKSKSYDWSRYEAADEALDDSSSILSLYTRHNIQKSSHCGSYSWSTWNREHIWTQSKYPKSNTDNHNIFACEGQINNHRGNYPFAEVPHIAGNTKQVFGHDTGCYWTKSAFEPCDEAKGEVARSVMYGTVMYSYTMTEEIDSVELALKWHLEHPVTERDTVRNNVVYGLQGNRNPFVDHPEYACKIWGNTNSATQALCGSQQVTLSSIKLGGSYKTSFKVNDAFTYSGLTVTAYYSDGSSKTVTPTSVSSPTMSSAGSKTIIVSYTEGSITKTANYNITVEAQTVNVTGVSLDKTEADMSVGGTDLTLVPTVQPSNATNKFVSWSSNNTSVATVSDGIVHAVSDGTAVITVTTQNGNKTASCTVHVTTPPVVVDVTGVSLNYQEATMEIGDTKDLVATVIPSNATNKNVSWSSSDESVATVNNGVVTALSVGTAEIVVTINNGYSASCDVTVTQVTPPPTPPVDKKMTELVIDELPDKTIYKVGEPFDDEGLEVSVNYLDGSSAKVRSFAIPTKPDASAAGTKTVKVYYNENDKTISAAFDVLYIEETKTINELSLSSSLLKTEYYVGEDILLYGLEIKASLSDGTTVNATDLVKISYDFDEVGNSTVTVSIPNGPTLTIDVTVKSGEPTTQDEAVDFSYEFEEKIPDVIEEVTKTQWLSLEHYFNCLDEETKEYLKNYGKPTDGVKAGAEDKLQDLVDNYDEIILKKKSAGFNDFMERNPMSKDNSNTSEEHSNTLIPIIVASIAGIIFIGGIVAIILIVKNKKRVC